MLKAYTLIVILRILQVRGEIPSFYREPNMAPLFSPTVPAAISNLYGPPSRSPPIPSTNYGVPGPGRPSNSYGPPVESSSTPAPIIHKHVYVHIAPNEPVFSTTRKPIEVPPAQKHYRIVFIKAPTMPPVEAPVIPPLPQNEEKTIVYVLVKRPEEVPEVVLPTPSSTQPSKPEVYFIRYKTSQEVSTEAPSPTPPTEGGYYKK